MKNAVHVLPNDAQSREDFEWLRSEVVAMGGEASVFEASSVDGMAERRILGQLSARKTAGVAALSVGAIERGSPPRARATRQAPLNPRDYHGKTWITRPRPGVDRFSSAWLIRRFIDPAATFAFTGSPERFPHAVPFDMYQSGGFKHEGDRCTFEVLQTRFGIKDPAVGKIAEIVHDLDLKDDRFKSPHAPTIGGLVEGLRASIAEDGKLLEQGMAMFEALYRSFQPDKPKRATRSRIC